MSKHQQKELFTALGKIQIVEGKHRFIPNSTKYLADQLARLPVNKQISCTFTEHIATRSEQQLKYHWILIKYIADYTGYSSTELHDAIMKEKFGVKNILLAGKKVEVRKSISDKAQMPKHKMVELIEYDLEICKFYDIKVPTLEELGYIPNDKPIR